MDPNPYAPPRIDRPRRPARGSGDWLRTGFSAVLWFLVAGTLGWAITGVAVYGLVSGIVGSLFSIAAWLWIDRAG